MGSARSNDLFSSDVQQYAIRQCFVQRLPVNVFFPIDLSAAPVSEARLETPIDLSLPINKEAENSAVEAVLSALYSSRNPCVFVDHLVHSYGIPEARKLADKLSLPTYAAHMGKGIIDETNPYFVGLYNAAVSAPGVADAFEASDLCLALGWWESDSNSAGFTRKMPAEKRIDVLEYSVVVSYKAIVA